MKCEVCPDKEAYCDCLWGSEANGTQVATFCKDCSNQLWEKLNPLLQTNQCFFRIDKPGVLTKEIADVNLSRLQQLDK